MESNEVIDFITWIYTIGQNSVELKICRKELEEIINDTEFEGSKYEKQIEKVFHKLVFLEKHMDP